MLAGEVGGTTAPRTFPADRSGPLRELAGRRGGTVAGQDQGDPADVARFAEGVDEGDRVGVGLPAVAVGLGQDRRPRGGALGDEVADGLLLGGVAVDGGEALSDVLAA